MKKAQSGVQGISTTPAVLAETSDCVQIVGRVVIIMATYNGGRFVQEQIRSIQAQGYPDWMLYVRDDGSRDDTVEKILQIEREDHRVRLVRDKLGNQGAIGNFSALMGVAMAENADYVFFADQDDVWYPAKLASMLAALRQLEQLYGIKTPLLAHCDLVVVNEELQTIADSFVKFSRLSPATANLGVLLCQNQVTGCACAINRALLELGCPVPANVLMHDWWLALLASSAGKIGFIPCALVMYRQHGGNVLGVVSFGTRFKKLLFSVKQWKFNLGIIRRGFLQAALLEERIKVRGLDLPPITMKQINTYSHILDAMPLNRACTLRTNRIGRPANITGLIFGLLITFMKKSCETNRF